jgi:glycosyltransferase involved in cell wall biosynthesis
MRALMVAYTYFEVDNRVRRYAETLARRGDTVEVISLKQPGQQPHGSLNDIKVFRIQKRVVNEKTKFDYLFRIVLFLLHSFWFITLRHLRNPYDLIHVHSVPDFEVFAALVPKLLGAKIILDIHDIVPEFYASKFNSGKDSFLSKLLMLVEKICCSFVDHVIISNHIWGERLVARSVKSEKCSVILNYPDLTLFHRSRPKLDTGKFIVMYPGTLAWHQGLDIAVRAMAIVREKKINVEFQIYGKGPAEKDIANLIDKLEISDQVKLFGLISLDRIAEKMGDADLGIVPKRGDDFGGEAFSTKILEFMALGVPMLVAETKIDRRYFNDSLVTFFKNGDEKDLAEKILMLAADRALLKKQSMMALQFIEKNNWDVKKDEYLKLVDFNK